MNTNFTSIQNQTQIWDQHSMPSAIAALREHIHVICTGYSSKMDAEKANRMGIRASIIKPVAKETLSLALRAVLESPSYT